MCAQLWCLLSGLVVFLTVCCDVTSAQMACAKIDFNRTSFTEFRECQGKYSPILAIKDYASHPNVKPYRPKSQYFLSNNFNTYSCIESSQLFAIDTNTLIEAAIYLKSIENSYIEIVIYDADRNERIDSLRNDGTTGWMELKGKMTHVIHRARVCRMILKKSIFRLIRGVTLLTSHIFLPTDRNNDTYDFAKCSCHRIHIHFKFG